MTHYALNKDYGLVLPLRPRLSLKNLRFVQRFAKRATDYLYSSRQHKLYSVADIRNIRRDDAGDTAKSASHKCNEKTPRSACRKKPIIRKISKCRVFRELALRYATQQARQTLAMSSHAERENCIFKFALCDYDEHCNSIVGQAGTDEN